MATAFQSGEASYWMQKPGVLQERQTAQYILLSSMKKLDEGRKSRVGIHLQRGLMIAITALKARQILWKPHAFVSPQQCVAPSPPPVPMTPPAEQFVTNPIDHKIPSVTMLNNTVESLPLWPSIELSCMEDEIVEDLTDPFDFTPKEPIFPAPLPAIFPEDMSMESNVYTTSAMHSSVEYTSLTNVIPDNDILSSLEPSSRKRHYSSVHTSHASPHKRQYCDYDPFI